ncbi:MAG TPA: GNAT family N-acetyltransferase [Thermomicrobiales bacterium]|nr:GNAT family N-acetyltransferase [Thermomicrobiales bacterium]
MSATTVDRSAKNPLLSAEGQTYLVGEEIYLRPTAPADADYVQSWKFTAFPISPDRIRALIDDGKMGDDSGKERRQLLIVRRSDERPVGSMLLHTKWFPHFHIDVTMDPLFGQSADRWKGEALAMVMRLVTEEWQVPIISVSLLADETAAIDRLTSIGARECLRFPEMFVRNGRRVDSVMYECLNQAWVERLGDPAERELPRSGTGEARPVTAPLIPDGDPPANAIRVGPRVYLRPIREDDGKAAAHWSLRESDTNWSNGRFVVDPGQWWHEMKALQETEPQTWVRFAVCLRENDEVIGFVGIDDIDYRHRFAESESELINPGYRGSGYGSEAKHLLFDYAFNTLGLHMLQSWVMFDNTRSAAALRKQGYGSAGRVHWLTARDGTFANIVTFHLLADAWRAMPRRPQGESE